MVNKVQVTSNQDKVSKEPFPENISINKEQSVNQNTNFDDEKFNSTSASPKQSLPKRLTILENKKLEDDNLLNQRIQINMMRKKTPDLLRKKEELIKGLSFNLRQVSNMKKNEMTLEKDRLIERLLFSFKYIAIKRTSSSDSNAGKQYGIVSALEQTLQNDKETDKESLHKKKFVDPVKKKKKKSKGFINSIKEALEFYNEDNIILMKYRHLKTPKKIIDSLEQIKNPNRKSYENKGLTFEIYTSNSHIDFVKQSLKNHKNRGIECKHVPFMTYWPTFSHLNKKQSNWYFYWREQVLKGNYLDTDLSYIFIFVYELLNYSFNPNASFNVSMLTHLNKNYKARHPKLEKYLNKWISDMLNELGHKELIEDWNEPEDYYTPKLYKELDKKNHSLEKISMSIWKRYLIGYRETKFFKQHKNKIYKKFKESIPVLQKCYQEKGTNLKEAWFEEVAHEYPYRLFSSAVIGRNCLEVMKKYTNLRENGDIQDVVSNLFRLAENIAREENGEKQKIKVDNSVLPDNIEELILKHTRFKQVISKDQTVKGSKIPAVPKIDKPTETPKMDFQFDWEIINEKDEELKRIKDRIESKELEYENTLVNDKPGTDIFYPKTNESKEKETSNVIKQTAEMDKPKAFDDIFTSNDDEEYKKLLEALNENEKEFLGLFEANRLDKQKANEFSKKHGMMLAAFLSELNEKADEYLEDILLEETPDMIEIIMDYEKIIDMLRGEHIEN